MFYYNIGDEPTPGFIITDRFISPVSGAPLYYVNNMDTPFFEDEVCGLSYDIDYALV